MSLERTSAQNSRIGYCSLFYGHVQDAEEAHAKLRAATSEDIQRIARESLRPDRITMTVVGAIPENAPLASWLE
jgi:predicted Zn-dependent peptidase